MSTEHRCGPDNDKDLFADLFAAFSKHPEAARRYAIACIDHETQILAVDFTTRTAVKRIEGENVTTEFVPRTEIEDGRGQCCKWDAKGNCISVWL